MNETVTISKKEYDNLKDASRELDALYAGGVDNWEWYYEALKEAGLMEDDEEEEDDE